MTEETVEVPKGFFRDLPEEKETGFCEGPDGLLPGIVVDIEEVCLGCRVGRCHMFKAVFEDGKIVGRRFIDHKSEHLDLQPGETQDLGFDLEEF